MKHGVGAVSQGTWHDVMDVVVIGSGAAGLAAAVVARTMGLRVLVVEKTALFGGGAAISGGVVWIPANAGMASLSLTDSVERARVYLRGLLGERARWDLIDAYLEHAPKMMEFMHAHSALRLIPRQVAPDYYPENEGASSGGRMLDPQVYDGRKLGPLFAKLRPPLSCYQLFGGMMVNKADIAALLAAPKSLQAFRHSAGLIVRYLRDRLSHPRGTRLVLGNSLAAQLLQSAAEQGAILSSDTKVLQLLQTQGRIVGVEVQRQDGRVLNICAQRGVVLATGGFPGDAEMLRTQLPNVDQHYSIPPVTNCGDGIRLGMSVGGYLDDINEDSAFWTPVSVMKNADGKLEKFPHLITDRSKPGLIAVNQQGRRFVNEAASYHDFVRAMHREHERTPAIPSFLICDARFIRKYGLGMVRPGPLPHGRFVRAGYLVRSESLRELARALSLPAEALEETVAANNRSAESGIDAQFAKGSSAYHRYLGDPDHRPNPCLGKIERAPFYAVRVYPGNIGTSRGLRTDDKARVLDKTHRPIAGLYACGNDMNSIMAGTYPSGGITLGPALTFAYIAVRDLASAASEAESAMQSIAV